MKEAAKKLGVIEDRAIFEGYAAASIHGIRGCSSNPDAEGARGSPRVPGCHLPGAVVATTGRADGPYSVLLSADAYTAVSETTVGGYPICEHLNRLVHGDIIWAPAIDGAFVMSTRGGDFDLLLGTDVSIGYLSHDAEFVQLYMDETLTFLCYTAEASVALTPRVALTCASRSQRSRTPRRVGTICVCSRPRRPERRRGRREHAKTVVGRAGQRPVACSGCGIKPTTRPLAELIPAIPFREPFTLSA